MEQAPLPRLIEEVATVSWRVMVLVLSGVKDHDMYLTPPR